MVMSVLIYILYDYHSGYRGITMYLLNLRKHFFSSSKSVSDIYSNFLIDTASKTRCNGDYFFQSNSNHQYTVIIDNIKYPRTPVPLYKNKSIDFECLKEKIHSTSSSSSKPLILFWNERGMFGNKQLTDAAWCPIRECELTHDKTRLYESDLVITHMVDKIDEMPINYMRSMHQRWIFYLIESPVHSKDYTKYNGVYNMSSTYKHDSDFTVSNRILKFNGLIFF
jgi:hypothetical protein